MPSKSEPATLSLLYRDLLIAAVAVGLVATPLWIGAFGFGDPIYTYERSEVASVGENVVYKDKPSSPYGPVAISDEIACSAAWIQIRTCAFEAYLLENDPVETGFRSSDPENFSPPFGGYRYVSIDGTIYEAAYTGADDGRTIYLDLEPADPDEALERVSIPADRPDVPEAVREAAETGKAETRSELDVPQTPIATDDGSYYRVYQAGLAQPSSTDEQIESLARIGGPIAGLLLFFYHLSVRYTYVED